MELMSLESQGLWSPAESKKVDTEDELDGIKLTMNNLAESQKGGQAGGNG